MMSRWSLSIINGGGQITNSILSTGFWLRNHVIWILLWKLVVFLLKLVNRNRKLLLIIFLIHLTANYVLTSLLHLSSHSFESLLFKHLQVHFIRFFLIYLVLSWLMLRLVFNLHLVLNLLQSANPLSALYQRTLTKLLLISYLLVSLLGSIWWAASWYHIQIKLFIRFHIDYGLSLLWLGSIYLAIQFLLHFSSSGFIPNGKSSRYANII